MAADRRFRRYITAIALVGASVTAPAPAPAVELICAGGPCIDPGEILERLCKRLGDICDPQPQP